MNDFSDLALTPQLRTNLARNKFVKPTPVQAQAIPPALEGRDVVATAQTGTGKTLAFALPLVQALTKEAVKPGVQALILSPTRELAMQIGETLNLIAAGTGLTSAVAVGGMNEQKQLHSIRRGAQILIATPGRLSDFLNRKLVKLSGVKVLVVDEADRMLDMGFLPVIKQILGMLPTERQTLFFSATIETSVAHLIQAYLKSPVRIAIGSITKTADQVDLHVYEVEQDRKLSLLEQMLREQEGSFLVFARTKHGADRLAKKLAPTAKSTAIHGNRTQSQRIRALKGFQEGEYRVLVATDVAARGIHVEGIAHVVNYDLPQVPEDFIHRVGRTGRAGLKGTATTFGTRGERHEIRKIEKLLGVKLIQKQATGELARESKESHVASAPTPAGAPAAQHHKPTKFFAKFRSGGKSASAEPSRKPSKKSFPRGR